MARPLFLIICDTYVRKSSLSSTTSGREAMNWRSKHVLIPLFIVCIVLIIGIGVAVAYLRSSTSAAITIVWQAPTKSFTQQEQQAIQTAFRSALVAENPAGIANSAFTIIDAQRQGDWAEF